jgi:hypothetical protein
MESDAEEEFIGVEYQKPEFERGSTIGIDQIQRLFLFDPTDEQILFEINSPLRADESLEDTRQV